MTQRENRHNPQAKSESHSTLNTGGGANIGGDVIADGDVIGRDKKVTVEGLYVEGDYIDQRSLSQEPVVTAEEPTPGDPPYLGLHFFTENESHLFFGRDTLTQELIQQLHQLNQSDHHFLAIIGASGSGKSSLARAGLVPALRQGKIDGSDRWPIHIVTPTARWKP